DTAGTVREAKRLWRAINRPNLMVKIPATREGVPAIEETIAAGINVNVTLIFSLRRYAEVMDAYVRGLTTRLEAGTRVDRIASVASFFVSRVDTAVEKLPPERIARGRPHRAGGLGPAGGARRPRPLPPPTSTTSRLSSVRTPSIRCRPPRSRPTSTTAGP